MAIYLSRQAARSADRRIGARRGSPQADARPGAAHLARHRRHHRRRPLLDGRHGGGRRRRSPRRGPGAGAVVRADGDRLRLRRALLRGVRGDGAGLGLGLHLRLRHARRAGRVDHRLGPDHRVRDRQRRRRDLVVRLLPGAAARARHRHPGVARHRLPHRVPGGGAARRARRPRARWPTLGAERAARRGSRGDRAAPRRHPDHLQPAGVPHRRAGHRACWCAASRRARGSTPRWSC